VLVATKPKVLAGRRKLRECLRELNYPFTF